MTIKSEISVESEHSVLLGLLDVCLLVVTDSFFKEISLSSE